MKKRFSILLAVMILLCAAPLTGLSGGSGAAPSGSGFVPAALAADAVASGAWGDNVAWVLDSEGTLTISGSGRMQETWDYDEEGYYIEREIPWETYASDVTAVVIESGISYICENAFRNCTNVKKLTIHSSLSLLPDRYLSPEINPMWLYNNPFMDMTASLETIDVISDPEMLPGFSGTRCEGNCLIDNLTDAVMLGCNNSVIPNDGSIKAIAPFAFNGCDGLTSLVIPEGVEDVYFYAFNDCSQLAEISLPGSLKQLWSSAFYGTAWYHAQQDGLIYLDNWLIGCSRNTTQAHVRPGTVGIAGHALGDCYWLTEITLPDSVKYVTDDAFVGTPAAKNLLLPDSIVSFGPRSYINSTETENGLYYNNNVLMGVDYHALKDAGVTEIVIREGTTCIAQNAFHGGYGEYEPFEYTHVYDSGLYLYDEIPEEERYTYSVVFPDSLKEVPDGALLGLAGLTGVTFGGGLEAIGDRAFLGCPSLQSVTIPSGVTSIGFAAFLQCPQLSEVSIQGSGETEIGKLAFGVSGVSRLTIGDGVTTIGDGACGYCELLSEATIGDDVTTIGDAAFVCCYSLTNLTIGKKATQIGTLAFATLAGAMDLNDENIAKLTSLVPIENWTFLGFAATIEALDVDEDNPVYASVNNCLIEKDSGTLLSGSCDHTIPADGSVTAIGPFACIGWQMESLTIPEGITVIGSLSLMETEIHSIVIPTSVTSIADGAFEYCYNLTEVVYAGPHCQWNRIDIGAGNDPLVSAPGLTFVSEHIAGDVVSETVVREPDCIHPGEKQITIHCTFCGDDYQETEPIPATGIHTEGEPRTEIVTEPTCTSTGEAMICVYCTGCGQLLRSTPEELPFTAHKDGNHDGKCDDCGYKTAEEEQGEICPYCEKNHDDTIFGKLTRFFHSLVYFFAHLFGKM